jgi:CrcB protein
MVFKRHPMRKLAAIYAGGIAGALIRVGLAQAFPSAAGAWPWPTFAVNMAGALAVGYTFASFRDHSPEQLHHPFFATGVCGTLTTFSTMQLELFAMVEGGYLGLALGYCAATISLGYMAVRAGIAAERRLTLAVSS